MLWEAGDKASQIGPPPNLQQQQYAYWKNISTKDAIATALHTALTHLDVKGTYVRLLFIDYSSAFNTINPNQLVNKLLDLGVNNNLCMWINNILTDRPQTVRLGPYKSLSLSLSIGACKDVCLAHRYTYDCTPTHPTNTIIKFADDTTVVWQISDNNESACREKVSCLVE